MEQTIDALMEQTEECLREYAKKPDWVPSDLEQVRCAVSIYEKLHRIAAMCGEGRSKESYRSYGMRSVPHYSYGQDIRMSPRHYEYEGNLTSYRDGYEDSSMGRRSSMSRRSYGQERSMHSVNDRMVACLEDMMDSAASDYERGQILDMINIAKSRAHQ